MTRPNRANHRQLHAKAMNRIDGSLHRAVASLAMIALLSLGGIASAQEAEPPENPAQPPAEQPDAGEAFREALQRVMIPSTYLTNGPQVRAAFRDTIAEATKATVRIRSDKKDLALGGVVGPNGWIVTKASELSGDLVARFHDGKELPAEVVGVDRQLDLAVLKVDAKGLPVLNLKRDTDADVGEWVATVSTRRDPLAVGVVSVDTRRIRRQPGKLGVLLEQVPEGPRVVQVFRDTAAAEAGVLVNDLITAVNGEPTPTRETLIRTIAEYSPGDAIDLEIKRGDTTVAIRATLTGSVASMEGTDRRDYQNNLGSTLSSRRFGFDQAFQHDTVLAPNDCGGPLVDLEGRVVGFNIARSGRTESYAIPSNVVVARMYDLMSGNLAPRGEELVVAEAGVPAAVAPATEDASTAPPAEPKAEGAEKQTEVKPADEATPDGDSPEGEMPSDTPSNEDPSEEESSEEEPSEPAPSADE